MFKGVLNYSPIPLEKGGWSESHEDSRNQHRHVPVRQGHAPRCGNALHLSHHKPAIKEGLKASKSITSSWRSKPERRAVRFYDAPAAFIPPEPIREGRRGKQGGGAALTDSAAAAASRRPSRKAARSSGMARRGGAGRRIGTEPNGQRGRQRLYPLSAAAPLIAAVRPAEAERTTAHRPAPPRPAGNARRPRREEGGGSEASCAACPIPAGTDGGCWGEKEGRGRRGGGGAEKREKRRGKRD